MLMTTYLDSIWGLRSRVVPSKNDSFTKKDEQKRDVQAMFFRTPIRWNEDNPKKPNNSSKAPNHGEMFLHPV